MLPDEKQNSSTYNPDQKTSEEEATKEGDGDGERGERATRRADTFGVTFEDAQVVVVVLVVLLLAVLLLVMLLLSTMTLIPPNTRFKKLSQSTPTHSIAQKPER